MPTCLRQSSVAIEAEASAEVSTGWSRGKTSNRKRKAFNDQAMNGV
jgi:hypothetical protein